MLMNKEYAETNKLELSDVENISDDMAAFTMFEFDCGAMKNVDGSLMFPELGGEYTPLYKIGYPKVDHAAILSENRQIAREAHAKRVEKYADMVERGETLFEDSNPHDEDEWDSFFDGEPATRQYRKCELLVD